MTATSTVPQAAPEASANHGTAPAPPAPDPGGRRPAGPPPPGHRSKARAWTQSVLARTRLSTPRLLQLSLVVAAIALVVFFLTIDVGVTRNDNAVHTVGEKATSGITAAQGIKVKLAELDEVVAQDLLDKTAPAQSGFPSNYDSTRAELQALLVTAASAAPPGPAYQQPLANLDYALAHYHALVKDSFAASTRSDSAATAATYAQAHEVMVGTLFPQADLFDKANTYVLNITYDKHKSQAATSVRNIAFAFVFVMVVLVAVQLLVAQRFRRLVNVALAIATALALFNGFFAINRLDTSSSQLAVAHDRAFDSVHQLARARAEVVAIRQSEAQLLLDPTNVDASQKAADAQFGKLFHLPGGVLATSTDQAAGVPDGSGGLFAAVLAADVSSDANQATEDALREIIGVSIADRGFRDMVGAGRLDAARAAFADSSGFDSASSEIDKAQAADEVIFKHFASSAESATGHVDRVNWFDVVLMGVLVVVGLGTRLTEYRQ